MNSAGPGFESGFPPIEPPKARTSTRTKWIVLVLVLIVCLTPSLGLYWFRQHYQVFTIPSVSMEPAIRRGDQILVDLHYFHDHAPARGDIAVVKRPKIMVLKRVIGLPGETIEAREGTVFVNGTAISEPYAMFSASNSSEPSRNFGPTQLKAAEYFVLGDNRDNSMDSRYPEFGPVPLAAIIGRPLYILSSEKGDRAWERIK
jgi:signal peptidase I